MRVRFLNLFALGTPLILMTVTSPTPVEAGGRGQRHGVPVVSGAPIVSEIPEIGPTSAVVLPAELMPTVAQSPYLGTFRPDPRLIMRSGYSTGGGYTPGGLPTNYGAMSLYGPFSRLRSVPSEVVTYSRGYDGVLRPTSSGISYEYTDPSQYPDTSLMPTGMRYDPYTGARVRSGFGRYLLGQE